MELGLQSALIYEGTKTCSACRGHRKLRQKTGEEIGRREHGAGDGTLEPGHLYLVVIISYQNAVSVGVLRIRFENCLRREFVTNVS